ncbi:MAG: hypothetical protein WCA15_20415 [Candidatus Acidiferrales bacterium]
MTHQLDHKLHELNKFIIEKAKELGLFFVDGPDTRAITYDPRVDIGHTNGQRRGIWLFAVADQQ